MEVSVQKMTNEVLNCIKDKKNTKNKSILKIYFS